MVEKHKMSKDQQIFYECNMCNNTMRITFLLKKEEEKRMLNKLNVVDGQGLATNYDGQIQGQTNFKISFFMLK